MTYRKKCVPSEFIWNRSITKVIKYRWFEYQLTVRFGKKHNKNCSVYAFTQMLLFTEMLYGVKLHNQILAFVYVGLNWTVSGPLLQKNVNIYIDIASNLNDNWNPKVTNVHPCQKKNTRKRQVRRNMSNFACHVQFSWHCNYNSYFPLHIWSLHIPVMSSFLWEQKL